MEEGTFKSNLVQLSVKRVITHADERSFVQKKQKQKKPTWSFLNSNTSRDYLFTFYSLFNPITFLLTHWNIFSKHEHFNEGREQQKAGSSGPFRQWSTSQEIRPAFAEGKNCVRKGMSSYWKCIRKTERRAREKLYIYQKFCLRLVLGDFLISGLDPIQNCFKNEEGAVA